MTTANQYVPPLLWSHLSACRAAGRFLPPPSELRAASVVIDGRTVPVPDLGADDYRRMAEVERERITADTLARLDAADVIERNAAAIVERFASARPEGGAPT